MYKNIIISRDIDEWYTNQTVSEHSALIVICIKGTLEIEMNQEKYFLQASDLLFCMPGYTLGTYQQSADFDGRIFSFTSESLSDIVYSCLRLESHWFDKYKYLIHNPIVHLDAWRLRIGALYGELINLYIAGNAPYQQRIANILTEAVVFEMISWVDHSMSGDPLLANKSYMNGHTSHLFTQFVRLLETHRSQRHMVSWYAKEMNISAKYLTYICKHTAQKSPSDIINEVAIREIKQLLLSTNESVKEIAFRMGFATESSFCKYFRQQTGMSALDFRKHSCP